MKKSAHKKAAIVAAFFLFLYLITRKNLFNKMFIYKSAAQFIIGFEGFVGKAYWDYKQYTNGYGTQAKSSTEVVDKVTALGRLMAEMAPLVAKVQSYSSLKLDSSQMAGFVSFGYNLGIGTMTKMLDRLKAGDSLEFVCQTMRKYINAGGKPLTALAKRRAAETDLILRKTTI